MERFCEQSALQGILGMGFSFGGSALLTPVGFRSQIETHTIHVKNKGNTITHRYFSKVSDSSGVQSLTLDERMKYCAVHSAGRSRLYMGSHLDVLL